MRKKLSKYYFKFLTIIHLLLTFGFHFLFPFFLTNFILALKFKNLELETRDAVCVNFVCNQRDWEILQYLSSALFLEADSNTNIGERDSLCKFGVVA